MDGIKLRWKGAAAARARPTVLQAVAELAERPSLFGADAGLHDIETAARSAGLAVAWKRDVLVIGNPGTLAVVIGPRLVEVELVHGGDKARWCALLGAEVMALARTIHPHKPRLGRSCKLGVRVSPPAAAKLRDYAERQGLSEAAALDNLLRALP